MLARSYGCFFPALLACSGCGSGQPACNDAFDTCGGGQPAATLQLSCQETDIDQVTLTGPCSSLAGTDWSSTSGIVYVASSQDGPCHVVLKFATGYTYATDIQFAAPPPPPPGCCGGYPSIVATPSSITVDNPATTCVPIQDSGLIHDAPGG